MAMGSRVTYKLGSALACSLGATIALAADSSLFSLRMASQSENHATDYSVTFNETERTAATSLIEMVYRPPRLSPDLGEVTTGMCLLLKARDAQIVQVAVVSSDPIRFEVSFPSPDADVPLDRLVPNQFTAPMCERWLARFKSAQK